MKIPRSEDLDKSPGVFLDAEYDSKGSGTPGAIKQAKKPIFPKIQNFQKIAKNYKNIPFWAGPRPRAGQDYYGSSLHMSNLLPS